MRDLDDLFNVRVWYEEDNKDGRLSKCLEKN